jgi:PAS domain S-box-containing protein
MVAGTVDRSSGFERSFGYPREEILSGIEWWAERIHPEDMERVRKVFDTAVAGTQTACGYEYRFRRQDGTYAFVDDHVCLIRDATGKVVQSLGAMHDITERKQAEQQIVESQAQLKSLASELVLAEERERKRIAVHLHDEVCQNLAYSKMKLQMVHAASNDQTQLDGIAEVCDSLTRMMQEVQTLTFGLSSPVLIEFGLEAAVAHWLKEEIEQKHGIATDFTDGGQAKPLDEDMKALLFRSVRELLANVVKHSQARRVGISISRDEQNIVISMEDDGVGFVPEEVVVGKGSGGFGLFSIRERLAHLSGSLEIDSGPGQGCRSILRAPLLQSRVNRR